MNMHIAKTGKNKIFGIVKSQKGGVCIQAFGKRSLNEVGIFIFDESGI